MWEKRRRWRFCASHRWKRSNSPLSLSANCHWHCHCAHIYVRICVACCCCCCDLPRGEKTRQCAHTIYICIANITGTRRRFSALGGLVCAAEYNYLNNWLLVCIVHRARATTVIVYSAAAMVVACVCANEETYIIALTLCVRTSLRTWLMSIYAGCAGKNWNVEESGGGEKKSLWESRYIRFFYAYTPMKLSTIMRFVFAQRRERRTHTKSQRGALCYCGLAR